MSLTTYQELKDQVADWLNRTDLTAQIPQFIAQAEKEIYNTLRIQAMERTVRNYELILGATAILPPDYLELKWIKLDAADGSKRTIQRVSYDELGNYIPVEDEPIFFAERQQGTEDLFNPPSNEKLRRWDFWPTLTSEPYPTIDYCYYSSARLSDESPTNDLFKKQPYLYLWGALWQAELFLKVSNPQFLDRYNREYEAATLSDKMNEYSGSTLQQAGGWA